MSDYIDTNVTGNASLQKFEQLLSEEHVSGKCKKEHDFRVAYPAIERSLANNVPQRVIIETFNKAFGYTLHPPAFRKLLLEERKRYAESGECIVCHACGQKLVREEIATDQVSDSEEL
jgi:hypothetical protein